jgi:MFS family permease
MDIQGYLETVRLLPRQKDAVKDSEIPTTGRHVSPESQQMSVAIVLIALCFMYSVHNLIAPNMTAMAKVFHFNAWERDTYIGGELTMSFYFPGVFGALLAGVLSGFMERRSLLAFLALLTAFACFCTGRVGTFRQLVWARAITGFGIGGSLPVVYSLVGDWFPARKRASATAFVTAASGAGVFVGQVVATLAGQTDWRWPFLLISIPSVLSGIAIWHFAEEPIRGAQEEGVETSALYEHTEANPVQMLGQRHLKALMNNRTNVLVIMQAFPGNIPWGVIIVYLHDFLVQDLGFTTRNALGAIATLAGSAFIGVLTGGFIGELLHDAGCRYMAVFGGVCNVLRAVPFFLLFGWQDFFGPLDHSSEGAFFLVLISGGFLATMASPVTGAMLLNVNLPETRGSVVAMFSVLDDISKGFGTLFISIIVHMVGGRAVAYQLSLSIWVCTGCCLLYTFYTYDDDEAQMRRNLDEAAREAMVMLSKQRGQEAVKARAKLAGAALREQRQQSHAWQSERQPLRWPTRQAPPSKVISAPAAAQRDQLRKAVRAAAEAAANTHGSR